MENFGGNTKRGYSQVRKIERRCSFTKQIGFLIAYYSIQPSWLLTVALSPDEASVMNNKRKSKRFKLAENVMFAHQLTNPYCYYGGSTINYSMNGICLASRYKVVSGDSLCLRIIGSHLQYSTSVDGLTCMAEVKWCQSISQSQEPEFHIGLNYLGQVPDLFKPGLH